MRRRAWLAAVLGLPLALSAGRARAALSQVEPFDSETWAALQQQAWQARRPLLVVFSATWCAVCPEVVTQLAAHDGRVRARVPLWVVMTDVAAGEADARLLASPHYGRADRLFAFDGPAAAIRHAVDPRWRGEAPYVTWVAPGQAPERHAGAPPPEALARWFGAAAR